MSALDSAALRAFLQTSFDERADAVTLIGAGMFSQAFAFVVGGQPCVARVSACLEDFQKDKFALEHFASLALPIPRIRRIARFDETRYCCITERCVGSILKEQNNADDRRVVPSLFQTLDAIHRSDVSKFSGWGLADANGAGRFSAWTDYLTALFNQKFDYNRAALMRRSFFDAKLFDEFYREMQRLLFFCPAERYLIHGDYGFDNVVADGARITGVLDWAEFGYGDFLYDVAYLDFFSKHIPYGALWQEYAAAQGRNVPNFDERMRCYMLNIGLHDMAIAATNDNARAYLRGCVRTRSVLLPPRRAPTDWTQ